MNDRVGMRKRKQQTSSIPVRQCVNIKSKKHPDVRCPFAAGQGEFCTRHAKNPTRFQENSAIKISENTANNNAALKIQRCWKIKKYSLRFKRQGPAASFPSLAENPNDLYTLEPVNTIPLLYRWSYADISKHIWIFDVRSLSMLRSTDTKNSLLNPYTRAEIPDTAVKSFLQRCVQLRSHKYCISHSENVELTDEQLWHQQLLDVAIKYDALGYNISLNWFDALSIQQFSHFYYELWDLWNYRLALTRTMKYAVVPNWSNNDSLLFKWSPHELRGRRDRDWWRKLILELLNRFVSSSYKEHRTLGALYGMTAFAIVSPTVRESYPWLVD